MYQDNITLCGASAYEKKFYFNQDFNALPDHVKKELQIMCVLYTEDVGGILTLEFDENGRLQFKTEALEADARYDEIGSGLKIKQLQQDKKELLESLEMYYKVFFLGDIPEEELKKHRAVRTESMQTRNEPVRAREPFMEMQWKIGNVQIDNPFVLAPMAGVTDLPFRTLCKEQGAGLICMEMISAKAISFHNKNTIALMEIDPCEHPVSMQLFGSEPDLMAEVAKSIEDRDFDILDINMGCPVPKVVNNGEGSALLKNPNLIEEIVRKVSSAISKPLTVKVRIGFENEPVDIVEIAKRIEDAGAAALAVHGRTRQQYYSGTADWDTIRRVKEAITIPVIGNGDVDSPLKAEALVKQTGCDAVMVGRAVRGNPWLFRELNHYFRTGELLERPSVEEIREMILRHARKQIELKGEFVGIREMRKHVAWYTAGMRHSAGLRRESNTIESYEALEALLSRLA